MPRYEYKVVPAPKKAGKIKGLKGTDQRFARALAALMNEFGAEGWEYQRADTLPCEERQGLTGRTTVFQNMLIFRRPVNVADTALTSATPVQAVETAEPDPAPAPASDIAPFRPATAATETSAPSGNSPQIGSATPAPASASAAPAPDIAAQ